MDRIILRQRACAHTTNARRIVRASNRHRHHLWRAICRCHRDAVGVVCSSPELVVGSVHCVGPLACRIHRELTVAIATRNTCLSHKCRSTIYVCDRQLACRTLDRIILRQRACAHTTNDRRIICAY